MKNDCAKWKSELLEVALTGAPAEALEAHMLECAGCAQELATLRARREQLDALLPLVTQGAEPSAEFRARVLAAAAAGETKRGVPWRVWALPAATAVVVATVVLGLTLQRRAVRALPSSELQAAQKLAEWRAPSDVLLKTPGDDILRTTPKLGESYLHVPGKTDREE